ncbi:MAG: DUF3473 domain-containing protein [Steroidobacteraceae bacterium]
MAESTALVNAMTVDVEDYFHVSALANAIDRQDWSSMELRAEASTRALLELFSAHEVKATFFVLGWMAERSPALVREIANEGHEIACHGWSHRLVYEQSRQEFRDEALRCKQLLEDLTGTKVLGYRAASYSITRASLWALDDLIDLGFVYDSSIFPIRHDRYGIPDANRAPGPVVAPSGRPIVEFPLTTAKLGGLRVPCSGGGYFRLLPYWFTRNMLRRVNTRDALPFIFYLHPWEIDAGQPRFDAGWLSNYRHYTNLKACKQRLETLLGQFSFARVDRVLENLGLIASGRPA